MPAETLPTPPPAKRGAPVGNTNALKHGFYALRTPVGEPRAFHEAELSEVADLDPSSLEHEIQLMRIFIRRTALLADKVTDLDQSLTLLSVMARASHSLASLMRTQTAAGDAHLRAELQELTRLNKIEIRKSKVLSAQLENHLDCFEAAYDAAEAACLQHPPTAPHPAPQPFDPARPYENDGFVSTLAFLALRATQTPEGQTAKIPEVQASSTLGVQAADTLGVQAASTLGVQAASTLGVQTCPEPPASGCAQGFNLLPPASPVSDPENPQPTDAAPQSVLNAAAEPLPPIAAGSGAQHADDQDGIAAAANDAAAVEDDNSPAAKLRAAAIPSAHPDCKIPFACVTCRKRPTCPSCPPAMRHKLPPNFPSSPSPAANPVDFLSPPFEGG